MGHDMEGRLLARIASACAVERQQFFLFELPGLKPAMFRLASQPPSNPYEEDEAEVAAAYKVTALSGEQTFIAKLEDLVDYFSLAADSLRKRLNQLTTPKLMRTLQLSN